MSKPLYFIALAFITTTLSGCGESPAPTQDKFYNNFTYYNDGIKARTVSSNASFYPTSAVR